MNYKERHRRRVRVYRLHEKGWTISRIARKEGVDWCTVKRDLQYVEKHGLGMPEDPWGECKRERELRMKEEMLRVMGGGRRTASELYKRVRSSGNGEVKRVRELLVEEGLLDVEVVGKRKRSPGRKWYSLSERGRSVV